MAFASRALVAALRATADRIAAGAAYQWGHFGRCNCGHLAQTLTQRSPAEIHAAAQARPGDWSDQATRATCPASGLSLEVVIAEMLAAGLTRDDVRDLEGLSGRAVLARLPGGRRELRRNDPGDAVLYLRAWAELLASQLPAPRATRRRRLALARA